LEPDFVAFDLQAAKMRDWEIRILETPEEMAAVEELQLLVWPGNELEIVPVHLLLTAAHNGGLVIGAYDQQRLVGFVFGFPGLKATPAGLQPKHCSHMAAVHPDFRDSGLGFVLKRAQWQMVRQQGIDHITWTYDPLQSRNANLNFAKLGTVCNTYFRDYYGQLRDGINLGLPSDRFQVDWWLNSKRVTRRLSKQPRQKLDLAHFFAAGMSIINPTELDDSGLPRPHPSPLDVSTFDQLPTMLLLEIPADIMTLKMTNPALALEWRLHTRTLFVSLFTLGYLVTDFVYLSGSHRRSFYVLSYGDSTL
jgi:predicted GNAT superfamily acetyltransferase